MESSEVRENLLILNNCYVIMNKMKGLQIVTSGIIEDDIRQVAELHRKNINLGFISQLGVRFLFYLYQSINAVPSTILIIAKDNNYLLGFVCAAVSLRPVYVHLIRHQLFQVSLVLIPQMFSLSTIRKVKETLFYSSKKNETVTDFPSAELLSIAVDSSARDKGIASKLFDALGEEFKRRKIFEYKIIVGSELMPAQNFYTKNGAMKKGEIEVHKGDVSFVYLVNLAE